MPAAEPKAKQKYKAFLCFDVEATCRAMKADFDYPNEIIVITTGLYSRGMADGTV